ncbi:iron-sulfur cluster assembly factor IBA57, mitochondrial [Amia ocellicauda]|uniref:iron-sulfur cluster assembly factor IBA57, mitochondrial n=1 Tax=Amia ocellicauda TaxID=2972642 RepID=UPI003463F5C1
MYNSRLVGVVAAAAHRTVCRSSLSSAAGVAGTAGLFCTRTDPERHGRPMHSCPAPDTQFMCYSLTHRALLRLQGEDSAAFLQGLVTNDMELLTGESRRGAIYTHMLSVQGRTLFDLILYRLKESEDGQFSVLVECDRTVTDSLQKHLKVYKIRRKVSILPCADLSPWAVLPLEGGEGREAAGPKLSAPDRVLLWEEDPRTVAMGWRLVAPTQLNPVELISESRQGDIEDYHRHRYTIGLPEGVQDLPPGVALPLESNLAYMRGISFTKGCYIGQELTARTHHTGVIRKRLMPVRLSAPIRDPEGLAIVTEAGKLAGKHRAGSGSLGLALIRLAHANEQLVLQAPGDATPTLQASVPEWWPKDGKLE